MLYRLPPTLQSTFTSSLRLKLSISSGRRGLLLLLALGRQHLRPTRRSLAQVRRFPGVLAVSTTRRRLSHLLCISAMEVLPPPLPIRPLGIRPPPTRPLPIRPLPRQSKPPRARLHLQAYYLLVHLPTVPRPIPPLCY